MRQFLANPDFRKYFANTSWLLGERVLRMVVSLFVGIYVARYLGPERYGLLTYSNSFVGLFVALATLGLDSVVIRELVKTPELRAELLGTSFFLKIIGTFLMWLALLAAVPFTDNDTDTNILIAIIAFGVIFQSIYVIDFHFQAVVMVKHVVHIQLIQLAASTISKLVLIYIEASLGWFAAIYSLDALTLAIGLTYKYLHNNGNISWRWNNSTAKTLLTDSWPLMLAYMSYLVYSRIDRIMIKEMLDEYNVGIYSAAYVIYEAPLFISLMVAKSIYPKLVDYYQNNKDKLFKYYLVLSSYMTLLSYIIVLFIYIFHDNLILLTFGDSFRESSRILMLLSLGLIPMYNAFLRSSYITISGNQKILLYMQLFSSIMNVILNVILIKLYGIKGAVIATVLTQIVSLSILSVMFNETRYLFYIQIKSLLLLGIWRKHKANSIIKL